MAEKKKEPVRYVNNGQRAFHLAPREKSQANYSFEPGMVIEAMNESEEKYFNDHSEIGVYVPKPPSDKERVAQLEKENKELREKLAALEK